MRDWLRRYGIHDAVGDHRFFPTIGVAVATYLDETGIDWLDWEDRQPGDHPHPGHRRAERPGSSDPSPS